MKNCYYKEFKSEINNTDLEYVGESRTSLRLNLSGEAICSVTGNNVTVYNIRTGQSVTTTHAQTTERITGLNGAVGDTIGIYPVYGLKAINVEANLNFNTLFFENANRFSSLTDVVSTSGNLKGDYTYLALLENLTYLRISRSSITFTIEDFAETYVKKYSSKIKTLDIYLYQTNNIKFHESVIAPSTSSSTHLYISFVGNGTVNVYSDEQLTTLVGSYNGTTWTYA